MMTQSRPPQGQVRAAVWFKRLIALTLLLGGLLSVAGIASAHAVLESSDPAEGVVLTTAPKQVTLTFDETISAPPQAIRIIDAAQKDVEVGSVTHPGGVGPELSVGVRAGLPRGSYLVSWHVISADSHPVSGAFAFSVGAAGKVATASAVRAGAGVGPLLGLARALSYVGVALCLGGIFFLAVIWPEGWKNARAHRIITGGGAILTLATAGELLIDGPYVGGRSLRHVLDHPLIHAVENTPYGRALIVRLILIAVGALILLVLGDRTAREDAGRITALALGAGILFTFPLTGHDGVGSYRNLALASDAIHVGAMCAWLGGLVFLVAGLLPFGSPSVVLRGVPRFSRAAMACVVLLAITGVFQALRQVTGFGQLLSTPYGRLLTVKVITVAAVLAAAALSRRVVQRQLHAALAELREGRHAEPSAPQPRLAPEALSPSIIELDGRVVVEGRVIVEGSVVEALVVSGAVVPLPGRTVVAWSGLDEATSTVHAFTEAGRLADGRAVITALAPRRERQWGVGGQALPEPAESWELFLPRAWEGQLTPHLPSAPAAMPSLPPVAEPPSDGDVEPPSLGPAKKLLTRSVLVELAGAAVVLGLTAGLVVSRPAREVAAAAPSVRSLAAGPVHLAVRSDSEGMSGMLGLTIDAKRADGTPWNLPELDASLGMAAKNLGPLKIPLREVSPGHYVASMAAVPMAGSWQLSLNARTDDFDAYPVTTDLTIH